MNEPALIETLDEGRVVVKCTHCGMAWFKGEHPWHDCSCPSYLHIAWPGEPQGKPKRRGRS